jgi:2-oxoglutarate ferredoxin oxidoreductase subunit gamma
MVRGPTEKADVAIAGFGGQGVLTIALLIAEAGMSVFQHVSWIPSYSAMMRGGPVVCYVTLSNREILSPLISEPAAMIILDPFSLKTYEESILEGGLLIFDSNMITHQVKRNDLTVITVPSTELAKNLGATQVSNLILLGTYLAATNILSLETVEDTLEEMLRREKKESFLPLNKKALHCGFDYFSKMTI